MSKFNMGTMPLQSMGDHCAKCERIRSCSTLLEKRKICAACSGIHKFDVMHSSKNAPVRPALVAGRKATRSKTYGKAVRSLKAKGFSIRYIANALGISTDTVFKILHETK